MTPPIAIAWRGRVALDCLSEPVQGDCFGGSRTRSRAIAKAGGPQSAVRVWEAKPRALPRSEAERVNA